MPHANDEHSISHRYPPGIDLYPRLEKTSLGFEWKFDMFYVSSGERVSPFRTAIPWWGQSAQITSSLSQKRGSSPKMVN